MYGVLVSGIHPWGELGRTGAQVGDWERHGEEVALSAVSPVVKTSLPEFLRFKLFGKTILVLNNKFGALLAHPFKN